MGTGRGFSGSILTVDDIDEIAKRISDMHMRYTDMRLEALLHGQETRNYIYATDIDTTSSNNLPWKNRTHLPKLADLSFKLKSKIWNATLSRPDFFIFKAENPADQVMANRIVRLMINKLERTKFRTTIGRELVADFIDYGNAFPRVDYIEERDDNNEILFRGARIGRLSPNNIAFNPRAESFQKSPKLEKVMIHVAKLKDLQKNHPTEKFDEAKINKAIELRSSGTLTDIIDTIKDQNISFDGYGGYEKYFTSDEVEMIIYRGDVFDPSTMTTQTNRIVHVVDRMFVIRNEPSVSPKGFDGLHHAGARIRTDNLWHMGMLDNLVGMQYRINHLENLIADYADLHAAPPLKITGDEVMSPAEGFAPGAEYYVGLDSDVELMTPSDSVFNLDGKIVAYERRMDDFSGLPPEIRGIRTEGEKTRFEVDQLVSAGSEHFLDIANNLERALETALTEAFNLEIINWDQDQEILLTDDIVGTEGIKKLDSDDVAIRGQFIAVGSKHWEDDRKRLIDMEQFRSGIAQDPIVRAHISGWELAKEYELRMGLKDTNIFKENVGIKDEVKMEFIRQEEAERLKKEAQKRIAPESITSVGTETLLGEGGGTETSNIPSPNFS